MRVGLYCRVSVADPNNTDAREKSTTDQEAVGRRWVEDHGAQLVEVYSDEGISASRFSTKARKEFDRLVADLAAGKLDVIWCWEQSRLSRRPSEFFHLLDLCRDNGVSWVIKDQPHDPADYKSMLAPQLMASIDAISSEQTSERVQRGQESAATAGRPHGHTLYGYKRIYHPETRQLVRQEPNVFDGDGVLADSPAAIVREVFERLAAGDSLRTIRHDLDERGIPTPSGGRRWSSKTLGTMAQNPAYVGQRVYRGQVLDGVSTVWPPLVTEDLFWTVQQIFTQPERRFTRPAAAQSLLSFLARCGVCDAPLTRMASPGKPYKGKAGTRRYTYACHNKACVGIHVPDLDAVVEKVMVAWLSDPEVLAALTATDDSAVSAQAQTEAKRARVELGQLRQAYAAGEISLVMASGREKSLQAQIDECERRAHEASVPIVLRGRIGPGCEDAWRLAPLEIKRQMIRAAAELRVMPVGRGRRIPAQNRTQWRFKLGPDTDWRMLSDLAPAGLKLRERQTLEVLSRGPCRQNELHQHLGVTVAAAHRAAHNLMARGWVGRHQSAERSRNGLAPYLLTLTDAGREAAGAAGIT